TIQQVDGACQRYGCILAVAMESSGCRRPPTNHCEDMMDRLLTTRDLTEMLPYSEGTLRWMRHEGRGPKSFTLPGGRKVMYRESDVLAWIAEGEQAAAEPRAS